MKKWFLLTAACAALAVFAPSGALSAEAKHTEEAPTLESIKADIDKILEAQQQILADVAEIKEQVRILKIRASR